MVQNKFEIDILKHAKHTYTYKNVSMIHIKCDLSEKKAATLAVSVFADPVLNNLKNWAQYLILDHCEFIRKHISKKYHNLLKSRYLLSNRFNVSTRDL